ncbi:glucose/galactose transporter [Parapedobacter luteus]|uniref:Glucose/galactose transporter n=1 Tax=Parapedobacter luteus TaxID=623280 RepID=A0A1T5DQE3_9SPHI|nr:sugar MFS transporter [Parapedobacter luteus]SKB73892.1 glucose/galactose transporter [Parapedobacter luteus]
MKKEESVNVNTLSRQETVVSITIIAGMFFIFGFLSWINAILIPYFKIACELTHFQSYLVAFAFYIAYFVMAVPSSYLLKKLGFKRGMMVGFFALSLGAFIFVPAAMMRTYGLFLLGLFTIGIGLAILQTAANPYVTILGPKERAAQRISIMGICNKVAGILAPLFFAAAVLRPTDQALFDSLAFMHEEARGAALDELIRRVVVPYSVVGTLLLVIGIGVRYSPLPEIDAEEEHGEVAVANSSKNSVLQFPHLVLGALAIFIHVGAQVISIDTIINYAGSMGISLMEAKAFPSYTLGMAIVGYFLGVLVIPRWISQTNMLRLVTGLGAVLSLLVVFVKGDVTLFGYHTDISIWFVVLLGIPNSLTWAGIWPLALDGLGRFTKVGASLLIMGLCGNAVLPMVYGYFADSAGLREAYGVLLPCYLYLIYYAIWGHKLRSWRKLERRKTF